MANDTVTMRFWSARLMVVRLSALFTSATSPTRTSLLSFSPSVSVCASISRSSTSSGRISALAASDRNTPYSLPSKDTWVISVRPAIFWAMNWNTWAVVRPCSMAFSLSTSMRSSGTASSRPSSTSVTPSVALAISATSRAMDCRVSMLSPVISTEMPLPVIMEMSIVLACTDRSAPSLSPISLISRAMSAFLRPRFSSIMM